MFVYAMHDNPGCTCIDEVLNPREYEQLQSVLKQAQKEADLYGAEVNVYKRIGAFEYQYARRDLELPGWEIECSVLPSK